MKPFSSQKKIKISFYIMKCVYCESGDGSCLLVSGFLRLVPGKAATFPLSQQNYSNLSTWGNYIGFICVTILHIHKFYIYMFTCLLLMHIWCYSFCIYYVQNYWLKFFSFWIISLKLKIRGCLIEFSSFFWI